MITFKEFLLERELLLCGGNVEIETPEGIASAQKIGLLKINRTEIVPLLIDGLNLINKAFEKRTGLPLWDEELFKSRKFLSGSAFHFFDLRKIGDEEFVKAKSTVGDIDLQVSGSMSTMVKDFLDDIKGKEFGPLKNIGYKPTGGQYISLWNLSKFQLNVQIDFELVAFDANGKPTDWSQFSHGSAWEDLRVGVKGVFSKYLYGSLTKPNTKKFILKAKTARGKDKIINSSEMSFSVSHGLRNKYIPNLTPDGIHVYEDDLPTYTELTTAQSNNIMDLAAIFTIFFGHQPAKNELDQMNSFVGTLQLIKQHLSNSTNEIADAFAWKLWGTGAQGLYRGDGPRDLTEKMIAMKILCDELNCDINQFNDMIEEYYRKFK
jgi:hypothetical protein